MSVVTNGTAGGGGKRRWGFAKLSKERRQEIAAMGGRAAVERGTIHRFTSKEAMKAGSAGGKKTASLPGHMSEIGRLGGLAKAAKRGVVK